MTAIDGPGPDESARRQAPSGGLRRGSLSRDLILDAAYQMVKEQGLQGLSMPTLGRRLGAGTMSIYRHFRNKDELLDALTARAVDEQYAERDGRPAGGTWQDRVLAEMRAGRRFILDHPGLGELLVLRDHPHLDPDVLDRLDSRLQVLMDAGFDAADAARVWISMRTYTWGFALWEAARADTYERAWRRGIAALHPGQYPAIARGGDALADSAGERQFELGLELILRGAASLLEERGR